MLSADFRKGRRVELHPARDEWMRGDRFGEIVTVKQTSVIVKLDKSERNVRLYEDDIFDVFD